MRQSIRKREKDKKTEKRRENERNGGKEGSASQAQGAEEPEVYGILLAAACQRRCRGVDAYLVAERIQKRSSPCGSGNESD